MNLVCLREFLSREKGNAPESAEPCVSWWILRKDRSVCGALRDFRDTGESAQPAMTAIKEWASQEIFAVNVVLDVIDAVESDAVRGFAAY